MMTYIILFATLIIVTVYGLSDDLPGKDQENSSEQGSLLK
jgi:hypothetical protein